MRFSHRFAALCLFLMLALPVAARAEDTAAIPPLSDPPEYVTWLLETARGEIGYTEEKNGSTKYGIWSGDPTAEWCAEFLCWCVNQVDKAHGTKLLNTVYPNYTGTNVGRDWFIREGRYVARSGFVPGWGSQWLSGADAVMLPSSYVPQPGDWVFFSDNAAGDTSHVAMVEYCAYDGEKPMIHVIEGNNPSAVARNVYPVDHWAILGYGTVQDMAGIAMKFGNQGSKVEALQQLFMDVGLWTLSYTTDKYGSYTENAVKAFQKTAGLEETGIADFATQRALRRYADAVKAAGTP